MPSAPRRPRHRCLAVCTPGLEPLTEAELRDLGVRGVRSIVGGVLFEASTRQLYAANLWLRTATRVLRRVASFPAHTFAILEEQAREIDWGEWLPAGTTPAFRVRATKSRLYHTDAVAERLERISGPTSDRPLPDGAPLPPEFVVRLNHDTVTISVNTSGPPLYQRGWRGPQGKAPLRETLAASLLLAAGWDGTTPLIDPMCGSGTIGIEGAMIARRMAPGWQRSFAFGDWPSFEPGTWSSVATEAANQARPSAMVPIQLADRDSGAVNATMINAGRAHVEDDVTVVERSISETVAPAGEPGWLISNPPYGKRASASSDLRNLFARIGQVAERELPGWSIGLLVADSRSGGYTGRRFDERFRTSNGGLDVRFLVHEGADGDA